MADLIPGKGDITQAKIVTHSDGDFVVYCNQKNPIFFESFKKLYPTGTVCVTYNHNVVWSQKEPGYC